MLRRAMMFVILGGFLAYCLGQSPNNESISNHVFLVNFIYTMFIPFISTWFVLKSAKSEFNYKVKIQPYLHDSLLLLIGLNAINEMLIPAQENIRLDLFLVIPCIVVQILVVLVAQLDLITKHQNKNDA
ncbi:hypothetical protein [Pseudoalteromonas xiamenensis]|uniref:Uncharacterized protein n=1 Tax=Pseudoalteromonas xiamenensis TaxID=882626 RepID=A0A975DIQ0_9GAMM|nr:hypothetical protein [Pseudoalteromonas xiamenensis]QTH72274.1 hypothetical protein J5O05_05205 [Pseudoalteromonas xiamenensis]